MDNEDLYANAYSLYDAGKYAESADIFSYLSVKAPMVEKYWRGIASCRQMEKKYEEALQSWALVSILSGNDPKPHFHAAECLISLSRKEDALKALDMAFERAKENEGFDILKNRIEILKEIYSQ